MLGQRNARVLLVDDETFVRNLISGQLVAVGYVVRVAVDGLDAIAKLRGGLPDLILSDIKMPRMSGPEFLEIVRKRFPQIPVIVISAVAPGELPAGLAADAYFHKNGFGFERLLETMSELIQKAPLRPAPSDEDAKPVPARCDNDGFHVVDCGDCLREFRVPRASDLVRDDKWTVCVHCGRVVRFFIVEEKPHHPVHI
jgi:CheY-like chemotaxis protein